MIRGYREKKPGELTVLARSRDLIYYTLEITNNVRRFPKKIRFTVTNRLQDKALNIYELIFEANELFPEDRYDFKERRRLMRKAITQCKQLSSLIELCLETKRIEVRQAEHWIGLVSEIIKMTIKLMESDYKRFSNLS